MAIVIDANMNLLAERLHITSERMKKEYGQSTIDEIIQAEAAQGNTHAVQYANEMFHSPEKLISIFRLTDVENKFLLLQSMDEKTRLEVLPLLEKEDLVMGLYFFNKDKLLEMLMQVDIEELVNVVLDAFPPEQVVAMIPEEDLAMFFQSKDLEKYVITDAIDNLPPDVMQKFLECVTGQPYDKIEDPQGVIKSIEELPEDKFKDFMSLIDPEVQRQLVFQITQEDEKYFQLFDNGMYVDMLGTLMKNDMIPSMIALEQETLINMISVLPEDLLSTVAAQVDTKEFAKFLLDGHKDVLEKALMM